ncbi:MAG: hypothetical protein HY718_15995 [Planctomycetes bacterium]|nr:hypothetical protein [Planctomycetota bacterium]
MNGWLTMAGATAMAVIAASAQAAFNAPATWTRGQAGTTYQEWNVFTSATAPNSPDVGSFNPNGTATVTNATDGFIAGGENIYSPFGPLDIDVAVPDYAAGSSVTTVILQTRTLGAEINMGTMNIGGVTPVDQGELLREALGGPGGYAVETWFKFHLPYSAPSFTVEFAATGPHMSLDRVAVDSITGPTYLPEPNPVPEPVMASLLGLGMVLCGARRRAGTA